MRCSVKSAWLSILDDGSNNNNHEAYFAPFQNGAEKKRCALQLAVFPTLHLAVAVKKELNKEL